MNQKPETNFRPPVVTIMGHVNHGKTTLLDAIRKTNVVAKEHGGITQHIGAYQITYEGKPITFVDTPGHAAFEKMRSRGAEICDIVILVVAATEGVKPQTIEAIKHIKKAKKPTIVVITKTDLPNINIDKVKKELQANDIVIEGFGGNVPLQEVSALQNKGISDLLDMIHLVWQMSPEPDLFDSPLKAIVVESFLDKKKGPIVAVIVKNGVLKVGHQIQVDAETVKVRALIDDLGKNISEASPSKPVEILGFKKTLEVGSVVRELIKTPELEKHKETTLADLIAKSQEAKANFKVIIRADVLGSLEAIEANIPKKIMILASGTGQVHPSDINLAKISQSPILAFNIKIPTDIKSLADREGVIVRPYNVIYELISDLENIAESFKQAKHEAKIQGVAKIVASFEIDGKKIAGAKITKGKIRVGDALIMRNLQGETKESKIVSLKKFKKDVESASAGQECGIGLSPQVDFQEGYIIESLG
ncbi:MAG: Translation initiation factor IF-2 [Candidatus Curtissbacteria bacterium GW2011_GWA1_40_16]|uniref:Translation initiation factor IF-2 n=1 Tax=Candidatus Curtissbacteria bacterium GW2011_GWA1_40_16 TaxID=1618405 RepID=A0A0G0R629_9BACT|nr:MAG: Translation initiation factor IF-2 [Candidatus Curtissbacteria bacterium GW2011_GWA1_40_16]